mmetsp:Transcript_10615/g.27847  ORF Transcript_10615/g.27847 Transcript_10615/m.27847 type:complete len:281 (-) Transcript_10615:18-860(-)
MAINLPGLVLSQDSHVGSPRVSSPRATHGRGVLEDHQSSRHKRVPREARGLPRHPVRRHFLRPFDGILGCAVHDDAAFSAVERFTAASLLRVTRPPDDVVPKIPGQEVLQPDEPGSLVAVRRVIPPIFFEELRIRGAPHPVEARAVLVDREMEVALCEVLVLRYFAYRALPPSASTRPQFAEGAVTRRDVMFTPTVPSDLLAHPDLGVHAPSASNAGALRRLPKGADGIPWVGIRAGRLRGCRSFRTPRHVFSNHLIRSHFLPATPIGPHRGLQTSTAPP